jgi:hypothetical protein
MIANSNRNTAERIGLLLGRMWLRLRQREIVLARSLTKAGMSGPAAHASISIAALLALAMVIHHSSIAVGTVVIALLLLFSIPSRSNGREDVIVPDDDEPKLRQGMLGFGLYDRHDMRVDPYDLDDQSL